MVKKLALSIATLLGTCFVMFIVFFSMVVYVPKLAETGLPGDPVTIVFLIVMGLIGLGGLWLIYKIIRGPKKESA
ncbi:MAG: hypothetical protein AAF569_09295 [Pseudomonadota bacterium]